MATVDEYIRNRDAAATSQTSYNTKMTRLENARNSYFIEVTTNFADTVNCFADLRHRLDKGNGEEDWEGKRVSDIDNDMNTTNATFLTLSDLYENVLTEMDIKIESYRESMEEAKAEKEYYQSLVDTYDASEEE